MKYKIILAFIIVMYLLPISLNTKNTGMYNSTSELMWCKDKDVCIHELIHYMDDRLDWPSQSNEFQEIAIMRYSEIEKYSQEIMGFKIEYAQLYANIYRYYYTHNENMPDEFASFYDWSIIDGLSTEPGLYWLGYYTIKWKLYASDI